MNGSRADGSAGTTILRGVRPLGGPPRDVTVQGGRIAAVTAPGNGSGTGAADATTADCDGLIMLPALVDLHTHLREPGDTASETIASGTRAAAHGGYSDVLAMANCVPVTDSPERVRHIIERAARTASCRVHPVGAVTKGLAGRELAPLDAMAAAGALMFSDDGVCVDDPTLLVQALEAARRTGTLVAQHAQCPRLAERGQVNAGAAAHATGLPPWPATGEEAIVARDVVLAGATGGRLHICHVSTAGTVEIVRWAKSRGWPVTAEVTPHHLLLTDLLTHDTDPLHKVNPPLRSAEDVAALRAALGDGTIDAVATDHAPHTASSKDRHWCEAPFGMLGLETALPVVAEALGAGGEPDWGLVATVMSAGPARIAGLADVAGRPLRAGEPATFTLVDPRADWRVDRTESISASDNTPFHGMTFRHRVVATMVEGCVTADIDHRLGSRRRACGR
ncbi:dihydroorotase [Streptomyces albipurpureus]|uniref:dihydroorotase n=1 Tax=Streptomyces albipurpureus TaxID=2897419 RepID=UPI003CE5C35D